MLWSKRKGPEVPLHERALGYWHGLVRGAASGHVTTGLTHEQALSERPSGTTCDLTLQVAALAVRERWGPSPTAVQVAESLLDLLPCNSPFAFVSRLRQGIQPPASGRHTEVSGEHSLGMAFATLSGVLSNGDLASASDTAYAVSSVVGCSSAIDAGQAVALIASSAMAGVAPSQSLERAGRRLGLTEVPLLVRDVRKLQARELTPTECWNAVADFYPRFKLREPEIDDSKWRHAIPNLAFVLLALAYGEDESETCIRLARDFGADAATNASVVGGIVGAYLGEKALCSSDAVIDHMVIGWDGLTLSQAASRTVEVILRSGRAR